MVCNAYVFSFEYKIGWCYVSCMHIPTVSSGTVQPDICYDKLKGQLRNWKQKLRHNQKKGHNLSCPTERGDILILDGDTQINTRN